MASTSLYDTFGNDIKYRIDEGTIRSYLVNSTIDFPLPEAASDILAGYVSTTGSIDGALYDQVTQKLIVVGFKKPKALTMAKVLLAVASSEGINPLVYFDDPDSAIKLTQDGYDAMNNIRPIGNRVSITTATKNSANTKFSNIIQP